MRLIDADEFYERIDNDTDLCAEMESDGLNALKKYLDLQPTAYDIDKVVEELEKLADESYKAYCIAFYFDDRAEYDAYTNAIEIVNKGGVEKDVCEWHKVKNDNAYKCNTHAEIHDSRVLDWCRCPYCGKKIKVVE